LSILENIPEIEVTLIESSALETIGVGEATQPGVLRYFREYLNLADEEWMSEADGTYKAGGSFTNFNSLDESDVVTHALVTPEEEYFSNVYNWGIKKYVEGVANTDYSSSFYHASHMKDANKFSYLGEEDWYAFQFDATKFAAIAKRISLKRGMTHIDDLVIDTNVVEGVITAVQTENNGTIEADFFIDCSGFKSLLINKALGDEFVDVSDTLPNNNAIATKIQYKDREKELVPVTGATALGNGWVWNIPLWSRIGTGYVYSDMYVNSEAAEKEFRQHLASEFGQDRADEAEMRHIKMRIGHQANPWKNNCLAIGLSSHFVEPLESTGLTFVIDALTKFMSLIKNNNLNHNELMRQRFNKHTIGIFEEARDFVLMHYLNTQRSDTKYWKHIKDSIKPTESVLYYLFNLDADWRWQPAVGRDKLFNDKSWEQIVIGFNLIDMRDNIHINGKALDEDSMLSQKDDIDNILETFKTRQSEMLTRVNAMETLQSYMLSLYAS
jgi:tryptophan halogenase